MEQFIITTLTDTTETVIVTADSQEQVWEYLARECQRVVGHFITFESFLGRYPSLHDLSREDLLNYASALLDYANDLPFRVGDKTLNSVSPSDLVDGMNYNTLEDWFSVQRLDDYLNTHDAGTIE